MKRIWPSLIAILIGLAHLVGAQVPTDPNLPPGSQPLETHTAFRIIPNSLVVNNTGRPVAALSVPQKFQLFVKQTVSPGVVVLAAAAAGIQQAGDSSPKYGQGGEAYAQRFGANIAGLASGSLFSNAILPVVFHQDPRYFRKGTGSARSRVRYAIARIFVARQDSGSETLNFSQLGGTAASIALSNVYYPEVDRTASQNASRFGTALAIQAAVNILREIGPFGRH